jgi:hypothetical protein
MFFDGSAGSADLELVIFGLALPSVPFSDVVASYSYELLPDERWVPRSDQSVLRVDVRPDRVTLHALAQGLLVGGSLLAAGESTALQDNVVISTPSGELRFVPNNGDYKGFLLAETAMRLGVMNGQTAEIGRKPNAPGLAFPNRAGQENIRWCSGARAARARRKEFSLDRMLTGRRQAAVKVVDGSLELVPLHEECPTYLMRGNQDIKLVKQTVEAQFGDFVIAGINVVLLRGDE